MTAPLLTFAQGRDGVHVDLERLIASRMLIQAGSGGGKSWLLRYLLEQTHGHVQQIVIDTEGEFSSLRERYDYLLAGKEGDVPADPRSARLLCRRLMELGASAVLDLYDLPLPDRRRFVRLFLEELVHLPRTLWRPLLLPIDEAHLFCPEKGSGEAESTAAVIAACTLGRKRGYCPILATQRISKLNKDAAAELHNKVIGLTTLDVDIKRAGDELGFDKEQRASLRELAPGTWYAFGPAIGAVGVALVRSGDVQTTHPKAGEIAPPAPPAPAAIAQLLAQLQDLPARAEEEARTVEELQARLRELEAGTKRRNPGTIQPDPETIARAVDEAVRAERASFDQAIATLVEKIRGGLEPVTAVLDHYQTITASSSTPAPDPAPRQGSRPFPRWTSVPPTPAPSSTPPERTDISGPQQRILDAAAAYLSFGDPAPPKVSVAVLAGYKPGSGHVNNVFGTLSSAGLITYPTPGTVALTPEGRRHARAFAIRSLEHLHARWMVLLNGPQQKVLAPLLEAYPESMPIGELAEAAGYAAGTGHFNNIRGRLSTLGAIEYPRPGWARASALLFPRGLPREQTANEVER